MLENNAILKGRKIDRRQTTVVACGTDFSNCSLNLRQTSHQNTGKNRSCYNAKEIKYPDLCLIAYFFKMATAQRGCGKTNKERNNSINMSTD